MTPYDQLATVYAAVWQYAVQNNFEIAGPPMEFYLNDPREVGESETLTEIQFPVVKR